MRENQSGGGAGGSARTGIRNGFLRELKLIIDPRSIRDG